MTTTAIDYAEKAARGAAFLDDHEPGWADKIDLGTLALIHPCLCVLGQVLRLNPDGRDGYDYGLRALFHEDGKKAGEHGFNLPQHRYAELRQAAKYNSSLGDLDETVESEYRLLQAAWIPEIQKRQTPNKEA